MTPREMISNSKKWAQARNLLRKNKVHGADEWRIPTKETFKHTATKGQSSRIKGAMDLEETLEIYLNLPNVSS